MPRPRLTAVQALLPYRIPATQKAAAGRFPTVAALRPQSATGEPYRLYACTADLGATPTHAGHPQLKHCFAKLVDADGTVVRTWAFGPGGMVPEPYPDLESVACRIQGQGLNEAAVRRFHAALGRCDARGYQWGENDCCACLEQAVRDGLDMVPDDRIRQAARAIAAAPDLSSAAALF